MKAAREPTHISSLASLPLGERLKRRWFGKCNKPHNDRALTKPPHHDNATQWHTICWNAQTTTLHAPWPQAQWKLLKRIYHPYCPDPWMWPSAQQFTKVGEQCWKLRPWFNKAGQRSFLASSTRLSRWVKLASMLRYIWCVWFMLGIRRTGHIDRLNFAYGNLPS